MSEPVLAALFDLDGTLLDVEDAHTDALNIVLKEYGAFCDWELKKKIWGLPDQKLEGRITLEELSHRYVEECIKGYETAKVLPGAHFVTDYFASSKIPIAICTSSTAKAVEIKRKTDPILFDRFQFFLCGDTPGLARGKPHPDIYLKGAEMIGVDPKNILVFEDSLTGVKSGKAAGMRVVAIPDKRIDSKPFEGLADEILGSLEEFDPT